MSRLKIIGWVLGLVLASAVVFYVYTAPFNYQRLPGVRIGGQLTEHPTNWNTIDVDGVVYLKMEGFPPVVVKVFYASDEGGELYLINAHIAEYRGASRDGHAPTRPRKLLLHKRQIGKMIGAIQREGMTLVPLKLYFNDRGRAKLELGVAKGKRNYDKRESEKKKDWDRQKARAMRDKG